MENKKSFWSRGIIGLLTKNPEKKEMPKSGLAVASLVLGIVSILLGWFPIFGWIIITLTIAFGISALINIDKGHNSGRSLAVAGFILGCTGLIIAILVLFASFTSMVKSSSSSCTDINCFIVRASQCNTTSYEETTDFGKIKYSVTQNNDTCVLIKEIKELSKKEDVSIKKVLEGKKMECSYSKGQFNSQWTSSLIEGIEDCQGELKEALAKLLLLV